MADVRDEVSIERKQDRLRMLIIESSDDFLDHSHRLQRWAEKVE